MGILGLNQVGATLGTTLELEVKGSGTCGGSSSSSF